MLQLRNRNLQELNKKVTVESDGRAVFISNKGAAAESELARQ